MRIALTLLCVLLAGCGRHARTVTPLPWEGLSLAEMEAQWNRMYAQYAADCIGGSPDHVKASYQSGVCDQERSQMAPLGNAIALRKEELQARR